MEPCNATPIRNGAIIWSLIALTLASQTVLGQVPVRQGPRKPTNEELLAEFGFDASRDGLTRALSSDDPFARIYALKVLAERNDSTLLPQASVLLKHEHIKVQLEAAKLLAQFDRAEGLAWLQSWEKRLSGDEDSADTAHVILDAASALAKKGDERLAVHLGRLLRHPGWDVRMHAARTLGDFTDLTNKAVEAAWVTASEVAQQALGADPPVRVDFVELYLRWVVDAATKQSTKTPRIEGAFRNLATRDDPTTEALRREILTLWESRVEAKGQD